MAVARPKAEKMTDFVYYCGKKGGQKESRFVGGKQKGDYGGKKKGYVNFGAEKL